jgi:hypothetical protein
MPTIVIVTSAATGSGDGVGVGVGLGDVGLVKLLLLLPPPLQPTSEEAARMTRVDATRSKVPIARGSRDFIVFLLGPTRPVNLSDGIVWSKSGAGRKCHAIQQLR